MCEEGCWSKTCVAELPVADVATAFEGGVLTAKLIYFCLKNKSKQKSPTNNTLPVAVLVLCKRCFQCGYLGQKVSAKLFWILIWDPVWLGEFYIRLFPQAPVGETWERVNQGWLHCDIDCNYWLIGSQNHFMLYQYCIYSLKFAVINF